MWTCPHLFRQGQDWVKRAPKKQVQERDSGSGIINCLPPPRTPKSKFEARWTIKRKGFSVSFRKKGCLIFHFVKILRHLLLGGRFRSG